MIFAFGSAWGTVLAKKVPNPNDVVGGWVAFFVVLAMGAAVVFLYFSLKKQLGKVNFEEKGDPGDGEDADDAQSPEDPEERAPLEPQDGDSEAPEEVPEGGEQSADRPSDGTS